jgi:glycerol-3-phosphate cytidylyltransferase-like family protein
MIPFVSSSFLLVGAVALLRAKKTLKKTRKVFRVYVDGCFDLMHFGHANALRQARAIASFASTGGKEGGDVEGAEAEVELIVGLVSDEEILRCKGPPVLPEQERVKCVRAVKWVDDIIANVPYELTKGVCGGVIFGEVWDRLHRARGRPVLFAGRDGRVRDTESVGEISRDQEDGRGVDDGFGGQVVGVRGCEREHDE